MGGERSRALCARNRDVLGLSEHAWAGDELKFGGEGEDKEL